MIFVKQSNSGTIVKCVLQKHMVGIRSYLLRELFFPFSGFVILVFFRNVVVVKNLFKNGSI